MSSFPFRPRLLAVVAPLMLIVLTPGSLVQRIDSYWWWAVLMFLALGFASGFRYRLLDTYVAANRDAVRPLARGERLFLISGGALMYAFALLNLLRPLAPLNWYLALTIPAAICGTFFLGIGIGHYGWLA